jgi:hypothetical protein
MAFHHRAQVAAILAMQRFDGALKIFKSLDEMHKCQ